MSAPARGGRGSDQGLHRADDLGVGAQFRRADGQDGEDAHFPYGREQVYPGGRWADHLKPFEAAFAAGVAQVMPYYGMPVGTAHEARSWWGAGRAGPGQRGADRRLGPPHPAGQVPPRPVRRPALRGRRRRAGTVSTPAFLAAGLDAQRRSVVVLDGSLLTEGITVYLDGVDPVVAGRYAKVVDEPADAEVALSRRLPNRGAVATNCLAGNIDPDAPKALAH